VLYLIFVMIATLHFRLVPREPAVRSNQITLRITDYHKGFLMTSKTMFMCVADHFNWPVLTSRPLCSQSSATHGINPRSKVHRSHGALAPSNSHPLSTRLSSLFHRSLPNTYEAAELQRRPKRNSSSRVPRVVEVAAAQDKRVCLTYCVFPMVGC
jgi:hypothetical protein